MTANTSTEDTGEIGPMDINEATDRLAGIFANSEATPAEPESENEEEVEAVEAEMEADEPEAIEEDDEGDVEYEAAEEATDEAEEPADYIEIDGERVTLDEVGNGYLRQADYTKKTQELAEQRKANESELASIAQEREHLKVMLENMGQSPEQTSVEDLAALAETDPLAYIAEKAKMDAANAKNDVANSERQRLAQIEAQQNQARMAEYVDTQKNTLLTSIPELAGDKGAAYRADILTYMEGVGFSKDELGQIYDARAVVLADKARKYDALMSKGKATAKKVRAAPKVVKPGVQTSKKAKVSNARKQVLSRARKSGSVDDAVAAIMAR